MTLHKSLRNSRTLTRVKRKEYKKNPRVFLTYLTKSIFFNRSAAFKLSTRLLLWKNRQKKFFGSAVKKNFIKHNNLC